jgi:hypothetical protein
MSRSNDPRRGNGPWKDSKLESRSQKTAWAKRKQIRSQQERARRKAEDTR